jgi:hypothetical protein
MFHFVRRMEHGLTFPVVLNTILV